MSRNVNHRTAATRREPVCTFCLNLGKTKSEYSHYTYSLPDQNGKSKTLCQELLATECKYCFKLGHTVKYCPALKQNNKEKERATRKERAEVAEQKKPKVQEKKSGSVFAALVDSDSEEEKPEKVSNNVKPIDNFPVLCRPMEVAAAKPAELKTGWAAIAAKPAEVPRQEPILLSNFIKLEAKTAQKKAVESKPAPWTAKTPVITKSWADWSDSEEEEYEDDEPVYNSFAQEEVDEDW